MKQTASLWQNKNILRMLAVLVPIFVLLLTFVQFVRALNESNEDDELPNACDRFALVSGNLNKARAIVLGENHVFHAETLSCLYALIEMLKLGSNVKLYYEGPSVTSAQELQDVGPICKKAGACQSWDDKEAFMRFGRLIATVAQAEHLARLVSKKWPDDKMLQFIASAQWIHDKKAQKKSVTSAEALWHFSVSQLSVSLIQDYQLVKSSSRFVRQAGVEKKSIFKFLFDQHFQEIRKEVPEPCRVASKKQLAACISRELGNAPSHKQRDKSLQKHVRAQLKNRKAVGFFIAGSKHVEPILPKDGLVVLQFIQS